MKWRSTAFTRTCKIDPSARLVAAIHDEVLVECTKGKGDQILAMAKSVSRPVLKSSGPRSPLKLTVASESWGRPRHDRSPQCFRLPQVWADTRVTCVIRGEEIRRYRKCTECEHKFGTSQTHEIVSEKGFFDKLGRKARLTPEQCARSGAKRLKVATLTSPLITTSTQSRSGGLSPADPGVPLFNPYKMSDPINNPAHYASAGDGGIECVDAIRAALGEQGFMCFAAGNVMKYVWRASRERRGRPTKGICLPGMDDPAILGK